MIIENGANENKNSFPFFTGANTITKTEIKAIASIILNDGLVSRFLRLMLLT